MSLKSSVSRRQAAMLVLIAVLTASLNPRLYSSGEKTKDTLPPELALVPQDSFAFVHVRAAEVWNNDIAVKLRQQFGKGIDPKQAIGIDLADIESVSVAAPTAESLRTTIGNIFFPRQPHRTLKSPDVKSRPAEKKEIDDNPEPKKTKTPDVKKNPVKPKASPDEPPGKTEESVAFEQAGPPRASFVLIVALKKAPDRDLIAKMVVGQDAAEGKHNGKSFLSTKNEVCLHFAGERTVVVAQPLALMKKVLDRPEKVHLQGPLARRLKLAMRKQHLVIGVNFMDPSVQDLRKQVALEWKEAATQGPPSPVGSLLPLLQMRSAALAVNLAKDSRVRVQASFTFPDGERAAEGMAALQDGLVLARTFTLGQLTQQLALTAEEADPEQRPTLFFLRLLSKEAEKALRAASFERRQATVLAQAEGQFDISYLRGKAKIAADNFVPDPALGQRQVLNNIKQMMLAMHSFHDANRQLPPAAICSKKDGKPLLSWRVAILPYIEQAALYEQFKLDEPWDSEHNLKLLPHMPKIYAPIGVKTKQPHATFYQVFVGEGTPLSYTPNKQSFFGASCPFTLGTIPDGTSETIGVIEAGEPVPWTKPADLEYDPAKRLPKLGGPSPGRVHLGMMDGSASFIVPARAGVSPEQAARLGQVSEKTLRDAITCNDGNPLGPDWFVNARERFPPTETKPAENGGKLKPPPPENAPKR